jgi:hypothetical protein
VLDVSILNEMFVCIMNECSVIASDHFGSVYTCFLF